MINNWYIQKRIKVLFSTQGGINMGVNGIYGLSGSGIDVESMVKVGMISKQKEYDKMQQTFTKDQWQKQAYNEIYGNLQTFNNSTLTQYKLQSNMNAK